MKITKKVSVFALCSASLVVGVAVFSLPGSKFTLKINPGTLNIDIVDSIFNSVSNPSVAFSSVGSSMNCLTGEDRATGVFGTSDERIYIQNPDAADGGWSVSLAASSPASAWSNEAGTNHFDFNDSGSSGCSDSDLDTFSGQMSISALGGDLSIGRFAGSTLDNISLGSEDSFVQGSKDSITLLNASADSSDIGDWELQGVTLRQTIPAGQSADDYFIDMTLSVIANGGGDQQTNGEFVNNSLIGSYMQTQDIVSSGGIYVSGDDIYTGSATTQPIPLLAEFDTSDPIVWELDGHIYAADEDATPPTLNVIDDQGHATFRGNGIVENITLTARTEDGSKSKTMTFHFGNLNTPGQDPRLNSEFNAYHEHYSASDIAVDDYSRPIINTSYDVVNNTSLTGLEDSLNPIIVFKGDYSESSSSTNVSSFATDHMFFKFFSNDSSAKIKLYTRNPLVYLNQTPVGSGTGSIIIPNYCIYNYPSFGTPPFYNNCNAGYSSSSQSYPILYILLENSFGVNMYVLNSQQG